MLFLCGSEVPSFDGVILERLGSMYPGFVNPILNHAMPRENIVERPTSRAQACSVLKTQFT